MGANTDERLEQAVATLDDLIDRIGACGLAQSVLFLQMAKLQLKLDWNGITDAEFGAFCDAIENGSLEPASRARPGQPRVRRGSDQRAQNRAWQCADGIAVRRVGRRRVRH